MALRIVTDSTSDLSPELCKAYDIEMVPLTVHFGPESFKENVEMDASGFWAKLKSSPHHPKTAQPSPGDFLEVYQRLHAAGHEILSIHLSTKLSGTLGSGQIAAQMLPEAKIQLVDTRSVTLGLGMMALEAARMAKEGRTAADIIDRVEAIASRTHIFFTLDTLEFLQKNGRVGRAAALVGGLLGIKPILQVDPEGVVAPADKVRGKSKVLPRVLDLMQERVPAGRRIRLAILHAMIPEEAEMWHREIANIYDIDQYLVAPIGSVVATNAGPGTIGFAFYEV